MSSWAINDYAFNANVSLPANAALGIFSAQAYSTSYGTGGDDTAAIQAACNAAATAGGGVAFLPPPKSGTLNVSSTIVLGSGVSLVGASGGVTITVVPGSQLNWVISPLTATASDPVTICAINYRSLTLGGNTYHTFNPASPVSLANGGSLINVNLIADTNPGGSRQYGLMLNAASGFTVDNVGVYGFIQGISVWDSYDTLIRRVTGNTGQITVAVNRACYNTMLDSCTGFNANAADPFYVTAYNFTFPVSTTVNLSPMFTKIVDCHGYGTAAYAVYLGGVAYANLTSSTGDTTSGLYQTVTVNGTPCFGVLTDTGAVNSLAVTGPITNTGTAANPVIGLSTPLAVTYGGTGTATPGLAGAGGVTVTGTWPNQTLTLGAASTLTQAGWFSVKDYGATGNGSTDDTTAIQAAITAAGTGGIVFFPLGTYLISGTLTAQSGQMFMGCGKRVTTIKCATNATFPLFTIPSSTNVVGIVNMRLNPSQQNSTSYPAIQATSASNLTITDVEIDGTCGITLSAVTGVFMTRVVMTLQSTASSVGVLLTSNTIEFHMSHCVIAAPTSGSTASLVQLQQCAGGWIEHCDFIGDFIATNSVLINPASGNTSSVTFTSCQFDSGNGPSCLVNPSGTSEVFDLHFIGCEFSGSSTSHGCFIEAGSTATVNGLNFSGCTFCNNNQNGVQVTGTTGTVISLNFTGCQFVNNGTTAGGFVFSGGSYFTVTGGLSGNITGFPNTQYNGGSIVGATNCTITGVTFKGNGNAALLTSGTLTGLIIEGCQGFNPIGSITAPTVGASPWTYTNTNGVTATLYTTGGSITSVAIGNPGNLKGISLPSGTAGNQFTLGPGQAVQITYSSAPTVQALIGY